jgi:hypothetical protein
MHIHVCTSKVKQLVVSIYKGQQYNEIKSLPVTDLLATVCRTPNGHMPVIYCSQNMVLFYL